METKTKRRALSILAAGTIGATGALATGVVGGEHGISGPDPAAAAALEPFDSCDGILDYVHGHHWALNPYPYGGDVIMFDAEASAGALAEPTAQTAAGAPRDGAVGPSETGTNIQEAGVDEPDIAKLAGDVLLTTRRGELRAYDVKGDAAVLLDTLDLPRSYVDPQVLVAGDKAIVTATSYGTSEIYAGDIAYPSGTNATKTHVTEVDISNPGELNAVQTLDVEGSEVSARLQGSTVRLVVSSQPDYPDTHEDDPPHTDDGPATGASGETGPQEGTDDPDWLPQASVTDVASGEKASGPLFGCDDISYPERFAGLNVLSVLTIDLAKGVAPDDIDSVMTNGETVYASASSLYVATQTMTPPRSESAIDVLGGLLAPDVALPPFEQGNTAIHRFDTSTPGSTDYAASGEVPGSLIGQFAMSEDSGVLRVASTTGNAFEDGANRSESMVSVLAEKDGSLDEVGQVGGLGRGEDIYAVRFFGDMGYVVTFEQTDPLYTIDLSDPTSPVKAGELEIPGYSAYLHPVGYGRLLGIGRAGTADGTVKGAQASLFDVSDATAPSRLDALGLPAGRFGSASAEWDHHAFTFDPASGLAVLPLDSYGRDSADAMVIEVGGDEVDEVAQLDDAGRIERALVGDGKLITVSGSGVAVRPLDGLD